LEKLKNGTFFGFKVVLVMHTSQVHKKIQKPFKNLKV